MSNQQDPFVSIDSNQLAQVSGGAARVASAGGSSVDDQLMLMLTQIGDSIKDLASNANGGSDQMTQMMMMMMMMGGFGGGAVAAPAAPVPTYVDVSGGRGGCKGW